jgi:NRPS condensation-like uncharacterized protein
METKQQFFPASIIDETAYFMEGAGNTTVTNGWILTLEGEVDSALARQALLSTFDCYPKYKCVLVKDYPSLKRWFRYCWRYRDTVNPETVFQEITASGVGAEKDGVTWFRELYPANRIDVTRDTPLKIVLIRKPREVILIFFHNHILSDGRGLVGVIRRFIQFYEELYYHRAGEQAVPDFESIPQPVIRPPWKDCTFRHVDIFVKKCRLFLRQPAAEVHHHGGAGPGTGLMLVARVLSPDQFSLLKSIAKKRQATINDYMLAIMFKTMKGWNARRGGRPGRFYINVPVSTRPPEDFTASNKLGGITVSPDPETIDDTDRLLDQVRAQRTYLNANDAARIDLAMTWILKFTPLVLQEMIFKNHSHALYPSLCLSNIGICDYNPAHRDDEGFQHVGPARIVGSNVVTAAIPWPQILIHTYNNRMEVSLSVLHSRFPLETADEFLDAYIRDLFGEAV